PAGNGNTGTLRTGCRRRIVEDGFAALAGAAIGATDARIDGAARARRRFAARPARKATLRRARDSADTLRTGRGSRGKTTQPCGSGGIPGDFTPGRGGAAC